MKTAPQTTSESPFSASQHGSKILIGRLDFFSVLLRLIGSDLYKIWRGIMSKVLMIISIVGAVFPYLVVLLIVLVNLHNQGASQLPQDAANGDPLILPVSLYIAIQVIRTIGPVLIIILVGAFVGREYGMGTIRLMYTRGPSRTLFFLSKIGAAIICAVIGITGMIVISLIIGFFFNLFTGVTPSFSFLDATWLAHAGIFFLATLLNLFVYAMMALFLATIGRSTAAGIAGGIVWALLEPVVGTILILIGTLSRNSVGDFLKAIPDYFIGSNIAALLDNQHHYLFRVFDGTGLNTPSTISDIHALLVLGVYLTLFIGLAWWVNERRDITN